MRLLLFERSGSVARLAAGRSQFAGFFFLGVLAVVSLSACDPAAQATSVPVHTEISVATQTPTSVSAPTRPPVPVETEASAITQTPASVGTPNPTPVPVQTLASAIAQTPTSDSTPTPTLLPDLVIAIEVRLKANPSIEWGDGCILSSNANLPFHVGEVTARVRNVGGGDAGSFTVQLNNAVTETVDGLKAGASAKLVISTSLRSEYVAVVDAGSSIDESNESNNTAETSIMVPTLVPPAPTCTPSR